MVEDLAARVEAYLAGGKSRTLHRLSRDSGVPYITLRRIVQREVKSVTLETAAAVLREISTLEETLAFVDKWLPESGRIIREFHSKLGPGPMASHDVLELSKDYRHWLGICLAERASGVSSDELAERLGKKNAALVMARLEEAELVEVKNNRAHLKSRNFTGIGDPHFVLTELKHFADTYDVARRAEPGHLLSSAVSGLNDEGLRVVRETLRDAAIKLAEVSKDSRYIGDKTCFWGLIAGTFGE